MVSENNAGSPPWRRRLLILILLLGGVLLRWAALTPMSTTMLHYDEAFNAVDALGLMRDFRLTPFLPGNFGRESGWMYWLIPFLATLGRGLFAIRFAATVTGLLAVVTTYRLGRELFPSRSSERVAIWAMGSIGVLYWHVHRSHLALRANLFVLVGTLAAALLLRAYCWDRPGLWVAGGVILGLLAYTYFASVAWGGYIGLLLLGVVVMDRRRRRGALTALACAALVAAPMAWYVVANTGQVLERSTTVSNVGVAALLDNTKAWGRALFQTGDPNVLFNLPERPILDPLLALLGVVGVGGLLLKRRWRVQGLLILGLAVSALVPSLFSNFAPHFLRGAGFIVPLCLVLGAGAATLSSVLERCGWLTGSRLLPALLLLTAGIVTGRDFHNEWLTHPQTFVSMEMHINEAANLIREETATDISVYFSPFTPAHPVVILRGQDLAPRRVSAFNSHECWVIPDAAASADGTASGGAAYVSLTIYEPSFADQLSRWADLSLLYEDVTDLTPRPRYSVYAATPQMPEPVGSVVQFGDQFEVRRLSPLPEMAVPGTTLTVTVGVRALRAPEIAPSLFLHLYSIPTPYEGGTMWSQADSQLCTSYPAHLWKPGETVIQSFALVAPLEVPEGDYVIGMGIYPFPDGARLPVVSPRENDWDYVGLQELAVVAP
jgi:hypothetical protein